MITLHGCVALLALAAPPGLPGATASPAPALLAQTSPPAGSSAKAKKPRPAKAATPKPAEPAAAPGPATTAPAVLERVQRYYAQIQDYTADFIQTYRRAALSRTSESRGKLQIKKPGLMRWAYEKPEEKLWLIDGKKLWVTDPEQQQVFVNESFKTAEMTNAISFLWGKGRLDESFTAKLGDPKAYELPRELAALELAPKKGAAYTKLVLGVDPVSGEVAESIIFETAGNTNRFKFRNARVNTGLSDALFAFVPPAGWDVIRQ
jgi:outer membrane lipoprotein carrier protein